MNITNHELDLALTQLQMHMGSGEIILVKFDSHPRLLTMKYKDKYLIWHKTRREILEIMNGMIEIINMHNKQDFCHGQDYNKRVRPMAISEGWIK